MKPIFVIIVIMLACIAHVNEGRAQSSEEEIPKELFREDKNINLVLQNLPKGWQFIEDSGKFVISYKDSVFVLSENRIDAPVENRENRIKRIKEHGIKILPMIVIKYENKWEFIRIQEAMIKNSETMDEIKNLADKMNISRLYDPERSKKNQMIYAAKNKPDEIALTNYYKEKELLEKKIIKMPDYNTQFYSLFVVFKNGADDDMHIVYPSEASVELYSILALFRETCGK